MFFKWRGGHIKFSEKRVSTFRYGGIVIKNKLKFKKDKITIGEDSGFDVINLQISNDMLVSENNLAEMSVN